MADYIAKSGDDPFRRAVDEARFRDCGNYLLFRHYLQPDQVRLRAVYLCRRHLLCALCAIRRGAKALEAYLPRHDIIRAEKPALRPFLMTVTVKDGPDLGERFRHLRRNLQRLMKRRHRKGDEWSVARRIDGAVWSFEAKRGSGSGEWHPHVHAFVLADADFADAEADLAAEWFGLTKDSHVVDIRPIVGEPSDGFCEVFKYAVKFSDMPPADTVHAYRTLRAERLISSCGSFRGIEIPDDLLDDELAGPYVDMLYRFLRGRGYAFVSSSEAG